MPRPEIVVVGGGAAGVNAACSCRRLYPDKLVVLVDAETEVGYYRPLISHFLARRLPEERLFFWRPGEDEHLQVRLGEEVAALDPQSKSLRLASGTTLEYEKLILAPGGLPVVPPACQHESCRLGVFPVRDLASARAARAWLPEHRRVVVLGGGLVGVKTAVQLALAQMPPVLVEQEAHLLPNVLPAEAATLVETHLQDLGIEVRCNATVEAVSGGEAGALEKVRISGRWQECDTLLVAIGSRPNLAFLAGSGLLEDGELRVSRALQSKDPDIFGAGDAATIVDATGHHYTPWTWPQAVAQGKLAAANLYRQVPRELQDLARSNAQNIGGLPAVILGSVPGAAETYWRLGPGGRCRRQLYLAGGKIAGGFLVGDIRGAGWLAALMRRGERVDDPLEVLKPERGAFGPRTWQRLGQARVAVGLPHDKEQG